MPRAQYLEAWLGGLGCVPLYNLMEDAATAEICRTQVRARTALTLCIKTLENSMEDAASRPLRCAAPRCRASQPRSVRHRASRSACLVRWWLCEGCHCWVELLVQVAKAHRSGAVYLAVWLHAAQHGSLGLGVL